MNRSKEFIGRVTEMSRGSIKIRVDENILKIGSELSKLRYKIVLAEPGIGDESMHNWLNKNNIKIFFTKNYRHFKIFDGQRKYITYGITEFLPEDDEKCAKVLEQIIMRHYHHVNGSGAIFIINSDFLDRNNIHV